ncbi:LXG domain-containing protein [Terribacillus sp. DMT04]|uniref:LXG domain-containing protein n=1 Tax=Terribacillus sp. DMT04 TaxID=2850441 RepID=UPI001C2BA500|nr:LXG domain-containing protein [Terribacillus sp. DMT04]QXE00988.1 LXG domain-containing protein [Terribacillus sp. DMT04]
MKQLHNQSLHADINQLLTKLDTKLDQMDQLKNAIVDLSHSQDSFTGATGTSIRSYYQDIHQTFISFYCESIKGYKSLLKNLRDTSLDLEVDKTGRIRQDFLEGELTDSLDRSKKMTIDKVEEANNIFSSINDIIHLSNLNADAFTHKINDAQKVTNETIEDLIEFDTKNNKGLETFGDDIQLMKQYVTEMESMIKDGNLSVENYSPTQLNLSIPYQAAKHSLETRSNTDKFSNPTPHDLVKEIMELDMTNSSLSIGKKGNAVSAYKISTQPNKKYEREFSTEDGWEDGVGNVSLLASMDLDEKYIRLDTSGSVVDTKYKEEGIDSLRARAIYGETKSYLPYGLDTLTSNILYGQHIGAKVEAGIGKIEATHENSPLSGTVNFGQAEGKANYEDYTVSAGLNASIAKIEIKLEPFNFFGFEPLEEWFGLKKDPYVGFDVLLGSVGVGASVGQETGAYASYGLGYGAKIGFMPEED